MMKLQDIKAGVRRFLSGSIRAHRPGNFPYITGDSFRSIAQHVLDGHLNFLPEEVREGDAIFVQTSYLHEFFGEYNTRIRRPYILITHNADASPGAEFERHLDTRQIIHWFGQNMLFGNPKATPIPIGISSRVYSRNNEVADSIRLVGDLQFPRRSKIFYAFNEATNLGKRGPVLDLLQNTPVAESVQGRLTQQDYIQRLSSYMAVASPPGNGLDCYRTWEALYVGTIPIVEVSRAVLEWQSMGIPLWIIDKWEALPRLTEFEIVEKYTSLSKKLDGSFLSMEYWIEKIERVRREHFQSQQRTRPSPSRVE